jgi:hypothetical protein
MELTVCHTDARVEFYEFRKWSKPVTADAPSKEWNSFVSSNTVILGSNPTRGIYVCLRLFCIYVVLCRQRPYDGWSPVQGVLPIAYKIQISELFNSELAQAREPNPSGYSNNN